MALRSYPRIKYKKKQSLDKAILQCYGKTCYALVSQKLVESHNQNKTVPLKFKQYLVNSPRTTYTKYSKVKYIDLSGGLSTINSERTQKPLLPTALSKIRKSIVEKDNNAKLEYLQPSFKYPEIIKPSSVCSFKKKTHFILPKLTEEEKFQRKYKITEFHKYFNNAYKANSSKCFIDMSKQISRKSFSNRMLKLKKDNEVMDAVDFRKLQNRNKSLSQTTLNFKEVQVIKQKPKEQKQYTEGIIKKADKLNIINTEENNA